MKSILIFLALFSPALSVQLEPMVDTDLIEGDILGVRLRALAAIPYEVETWPGGKIYYVIEDDIASNENYMDRLLRAMAEIEYYSCIEFRQRQEEVDYLWIVKGTGCSSFVGRMGGMQRLNLNDGCFSHATLIHELMHAIGFFHEHKRSDRDDYVTVHWDNIMPGRQHNFDKYSPYEDILLSSFDYESVMLYGSYTFSIDRTSPTITKKNGEILPHISTKPSMSEMNIRALNLLYNC